MILRLWWYEEGQGNKPKKEDNEGNEDNEKDNDMGNRMNMDMAVSLGLGPTGLIETTEEREWRYNFSFSYPFYRLLRRHIPAKCRIYSAVWDTK